MPVCVHVRVGVCVCVCGSHSDHHTVLYYSSPVAECWDHCLMRAIVGSWAEDRRVVVETPPPGQRVRDVDSDGV